MMIEHERPEDVARDAADAGESPCRNKIRGIPAEPPDRKEQDDEAL